MTLLVMWTTYAVFGVIVYSAVFLWAVRTRQFSSEDRARRLPLDCPAPVAGDPGSVPTGWRVMGVPVTLLLLGAAVIVGLLVCVYGR